MFPDDATAEKWFEEERWGKTVDGLPESIYCPHWGCYGMITECPNRNPMPYWCGDCRKHFSVRTGGTLSHSPIPYQKWAISLYLYQSDPRGISSRQLARHLGITQKSARFMLHRIREGWGKQESLNSSAVEIDETFFGGKDKNRHLNKKFGGNWQKGVSIGVVVCCRETGRVATEVTPDRKGKTLLPIVRKHLNKNGILYSDEFSSYSDFGWASRHESVNHKKGEYVRNGAGTNRAESFNALGKGTYHGTYHHVSPKYLPRYLNEFAGRYNIRGMDSLEQMELLASGMMRKRLTHRDLVGTEVPPKPFTHHRWREGESFRKVSKVKNPGEI